MTEKKKDRWLKVFCPEDACMAEEERFTPPGVQDEEDDDMWLELFCPENACEVTSPSQLP